MLKQQFDINSVDFTLRALALPIVQPEWYIKVGYKLLTPELFVRNEEKQVCKSIMTYYARYPITPDFDELRHMADDMQPDKQEAYLKLLSDIENVATDNLDYVKDELIQWCKEQSTKLAVLSCVDDLSKHDISTNKLRAALNDIDKLGQDYKYITPAYILAHRDDAIQWVVDGLFISKQVVFLVGQGGIGKSTLMTVFATAILRGDKFMGYQCTKSSVMWLDQENGEFVLCGRFNVVWDTLGLTEEEKLGLNFYSPQDRLFTTNNIGELQQELVELPGQKVLIIDNFASIKAGKDLKDDEMEEVMLAWRKLANDTDTLIIFIYHPTKSSDEIFGSQFIRVNADVILTLVDVTGKEDNDGKVFEKITLRIEKGKGRVVDFPPTYVRLVIESGMTSRLVDTIRCDLLENVVLDNTKRILTSRKAENIDLVTNTLKDGMTMDELADALGWGYNATYGLVNVLKTRGEVEARGVGSGKNLKRLYWTNRQD